MTKWMFKTFLNSNHFILNFQNRWTDVFSTY